MHSVNRATNPATTSPIEWRCCVNGTQYNYSRNWIHIRQRTIWRRDIVEMRINFINNVDTAKSIEEEWKSLIHYHYSRMYQLTLTSNRIRLTIAWPIQIVTIGMREKHNEKIVNVPSVGGKNWLIRGGWCHTTKFTVEGPSDCLRVQLIPIGVNVIVVKPGGIKKDWGFIAAEIHKGTSGNGKVVHRGHGEDK